MSMSRGHQSLLKWFKEAGGILNSGVNVENIENCGRGVVVTNPEGFSRGEVLISVPYHSKCVLGACNAVHSNAQKILNEDTYSDWWTVTLLILAECKRDGSYWAHIFREAPEVYTSALCWCEEDVRLAGGAGKSWLWESARKDRQQVLAEFETVKSVLFDCYSKDDIFPDSVCTCEAYTWMRAFCKTRGFDFLVEGKEVSVVLPVLDMLNHSSVPSMVNAKVMLDMNDSVIRAVAIRDIRPSEQVLISYDDECNNCDLLCRYGFVPSDNPNQHVSLPVLKELPGCEDTDSELLWVVDTGGLSPHLVSCLAPHYDDNWQQLYSAVQRCIGVYLSSWSVDVERYRAICEDASSPYVQQCIAQLFVGEHCALTSFISAATALLEAGSVDMFCQVNGVE